MNPRPSKQILAQYFPTLPGFRDGQEAAIDRVASGTNTLCMMPTGGGKSLVYQVAGIRRGGTTIVVSPLVALMSQQVQRLAEISGIRAFSLSDLGPRRYAALRELDLRHGPTFLFASPELLSSDGFLEFVLRRGSSGVGLVVIDEAHCVSQWGHTFRPPYKAIPRVLDRAFGASAWPPVLCLTATLNPRDQAEICTDFRIDHADVLRTATLFRENLVLRCEHHENEKAKKVRLTEILAEHKGDKIIVYVHRKSGEYGTAKLAEHFAAQGLPCDYFDADRKDQDKRAVMRAFETGEKRIVFATNAFGMGVDIPDVRVVVHYLLPESIEQYYQEVGRAGRDGKMSRGYLLFTETNKKVRADLIRDSLMKREEVASMFATKLVLRDGEDLRSIDPYNDIADDDCERAAFFALQDAGVIKVVAKGPSNASCFEPVPKFANNELRRYMSASKAGIIKAIARKLSVPVAEVIEVLWCAYVEEKVKLRGTPANALFLTTLSSIPASVLDAIDADQQAKLNVRLEGFSVLMQMVESGSDPSSAVRAYLGHNHATV
ncbi:ATP-dependent DNA helicase RecQ [Polyangium jinanense]|uniref:RecQ family ATP-dependent DNA helicase n=1 Tax=Polyangium jinanense TaxID=2829994 RepID=UPI002341BDD0|nr:RecQ family ATP-dependent DNA helicase [Polyangium jinanense]MDC3958566.1 ATP-dependent DNA helicase RecQ [Polyangium jinanense]